MKHTLTIVTAYALSAPAMCPCRAGDYAQAVVAATKALAAAERNAGPDHPDVAVSLASLAEIHHNQGHYAKVEAFYRRSLAMWVKVVGPTISGWLAPLPVWLPSAARRTVLRRPRSWNSGPVAFVPSNGERAEGLPLWS